MEMSAQESAFASYLQAVAGALARADATPARVLEAARARDVDPGGSTTHFRAPDPRFRDAIITVGVDSGTASRIRSVSFVCDQQGPPVTLAELAQAFGAWKRTIPGGSIYDVNRVTFTTHYPAAASERSARRAETAVRATLTADPAEHSARVREIFLLRFSVDP